MRHFRPEVERRLLEKQRATSAAAEAA